MQFMGVLFLCLTFLAGITVGTIAYALINVVVFLALALAVAKFIEPRFGQNGLVYGMAGAFFASFLWPYGLIAFKSGEDCVGDECLVRELSTRSPEQASIYFSDCVVAVGDAGSTARPEYCSYAEREDTQ